MAVGSSRVGRPEIDKLEKAFRPLKFFGIRVSLDFLNSKLSSGRKFFAKSITDGS